jgi:hypothetical protein
MTEEDRTLFVELIGSVQLQAAMFQGLLELLTVRNIITEIDEIDLFNIAEMRLSRGAQNEALAFARCTLNAWRREGLIRGGQPKFS